ncbi:ATP-binding protein [Halorussus amylolyticus]|uniref:ATP-binding protein n=1 Tax=Halorussus amylolyticus TaxID=1126242 RepID=UPI001049851F|nr:ATP-binding protein [Halorussus amylolyticus]
MVRWPRVIAALGGSYIALAVALAGIDVAAGEILGGTAIDFVLIAVPGGVILYTGRWLPGTDLDAETYPRVARWCFGGLGLLLGVVGLLVLNPGVEVNQLSWTASFGSALGAAGGLGIGVNEARAMTRAYEAERHERQLAEQNERLESFASMLAHELRNPLSIAQIYLQSAADGDETAADEVEGALDRIEEMIEILLVTARKSEAQVEWESVALREVATEAWADLKLETATLDIETDRVIRADPVHLRHLLENLFKNSVEHGDPEVTIRVGDLDDSGGPTGFYVEDDGSGIPVEARETVFDAGYTTDAGGIGLGLTFVARLAETYDWDCTVTESEAGGARFEFSSVEVVAPERGQSR